MEPLDGPHQDTGGCRGGFVVVDLGVGDAGVVVDDGVDVGSSHQRAGVPAARLVGGGGSVAVALLPADVAPASAVGSVAQLLDVDVEHRAGMVVLVSADGFAGGAVDVGQAVQVGVGQDPVDG